AQRVLAELTRGGRDVVGRAREGFGLWRERHLDGSAGLDGRGRRVDAVLAIFDALTERALDELGHFLVGDDDAFRGEPALEGARHLLGRLEAFLRGAREGREHDLLEPVRVPFASFARWAERLLEELIERGERVFSLEGTLADGSLVQDTAER